MIESGSAWIVDAYDCEADRLRSPEALERVFAALVADLGLHPLREIVWQRFPEPGGVTGFLLLSESHIACHTFPERRFAAFDLYCCRPRREWPWRTRLAELVGAERVSIRCIERGGEIGGADAVGDTVNRNDMGDVRVCEMRAAGRSETT